jgi:NitT/TauT family transport system permease protein
MASHIAVESVDHTGSTPASTPAAGPANGAMRASRTPKRKKRSRRTARLLLILNIVAVVAGITVWTILAANDVQGLPTPVAVIKRWGDLISDGTWQTDTLTSLRRVLIGFVIGCGLAIPIGFLMGWYTVARGLIEPYVQFFRTIPPLALIPLVVVLMGIGETPKIFVISLAAFLVSVISTFQGVRNVDKTMINAARVLGAGDATIFRRVVVPASTPFIFVGMRTGLGAAWATLVAAELIAAQTGLGYRMQSAELYFDLPTIFVSLITIGIIGLLMDRILLFIDRRLTNWQERA